MRKKRLWTAVFFFFRIVLVSALLSNETFDLSQYYAERFVIDEVGETFQRSYLIAAHSRICDSPEMYSFFSKKKLLINFLFCQITVPYLMCTLLFNHHFTSQSASSRLVVRALLKGGKERKNLYEYTTKPAATTYWIPTTVIIGSFSEPFKISIDCETGSKPKKNKNKQKEYKVFACGLSNIRFDDCMDIRNPIEMCSYGDQFLCSTKSNTKCLKDAQCDLKSDCEDGSDEVECGSVLGTMCDFDNPDGFCDGWVQRTRIMGSQQNQFEPTTIAPLNKIDETPTYLLKKRGPSATVREARKGSGQMLVYDEKENNIISRRKSVLQSPVFPRTNPEAYDLNSPLFETCTVKCPLACPSSSTCQYRNFTSEPFCLCKNGKTLDGLSKEYCEVPETWNWYNYVILASAIIVIIVASGVVYRYQSREKQMKQEIFDLTQMKSPEYVYTDIYFGRQTRQSALDCLPSIPRDAIARGKVLGKGNFGEVFYGEYSGIKLAVKTISRTFSASEASQADFCNEALCMGTFVHDNVVSLIGIDFSVLPYMIAIEFMEGGDLLSFVKESRPNHTSLNPLKLSMIDLVKICFDVASGCSCLESFGYVHRDIAARNILLTTKGKNRIAKIADFGMAKEITYGSEYYRVHGRAMLPIKWTPPEAFIDGVFTTKADVWSFGILCWEVFSLGVVPYPNRRNEEVMLMLTEGGRLEYPYGIPTRVYQLMRECWVTCPENRPKFTDIVSTFKEILDDPASTGMAFPIHPTVRASFAHSQSTPVSVETPMTAITEISLNSAFTEASTVKINSPQDMQDRIYRKLFICLTCFKDSFQYTN
ncbi:hypothetical protein CAEBREN_28668 [Caenorhabditis brenneri]|uniref:Protein kinase domain-containing protein n=1 Tax=Caenorhabditis brenneri TaxID=135651 RepID=G0PLD0_CAEBE|nr:hypothetical protein CAEBREN_28668 [Caenorhabditis brenneri]